MAQETTNSIAVSNEESNLVQHNAQMTAINLFNENELAAAELFIKKIIRSDKSGIKSVEDGLAILMRAKDLNLPFTACVEHVHLINGKTGVDIHIIKALLLRAGCTWELTKDYQPQYEYTDGFNVYNDNELPTYCKRVKTKEEALEKQKANPNDDFIYVYPVKWYQDFNGNVYKDYQLNTKQFGIAVNREQVNEIVKSGRIAVHRIPAKPINYVTEYEITRVINGKEITQKGSFSYIEAANAGMFEKDTYKKYPRVLIGHRAFTYAAREIASDIMFGVMETTELKIVSGKELDNEELAQFEIVEEVK